MNVVMNGFCALKVCAAGNDDAWPQSGTSELPGTIRVHLADTQRIVGVTMDDNVGATSKM